MFVQFDMELQRGFEIAGIMLALIAVLSGVFKVYTKIERLEIAVAEMRRDIRWILNSMKGGNHNHAPTP